MYFLYNYLLSSKYGIPVSSFLVCFVLYLCTKTVLFSNCFFVIPFSLNPYFFKSFLLVSFHDVIKGLLMVYVFLSYNIYLYIFYKFFYIFLYIFINFYKIYKILRFQKTDPRFFWENGVFSFLFENFVKGFSEENFFQKTFFFEFPPPPLFFSEEKIIQNYTKLYKNYTKIIQNYTKIK